MTATVLCGDSRSLLANYGDASLDSCVTDPPYELGFMGKAWDSSGSGYDVGLWREVFRVLKPGSHLVAFGGTRTYHRMAVAIEDAGFEVRDQLAWVYGSGFPKSHNQPGGWGTALKPSWEPICLARRPLIGTVAANMAEHGTGAINIDGCRIETTEADARDIGRSINRNVREGQDWGMNRHEGEVVASVVPIEGRWPANILHDGSDEVLAGFPTSKDGVATRRNGGAQTVGGNGIYGHFRKSGDDTDIGYGTGGSAARFFYSAKAGKLDRLGSDHPTVKPVDLMRWLVRMVTPPGGTVIDPFAGTGSTGIAAHVEGFDAVLMELREEAVADIRRRLDHIRGAGGHTAGERGKSRLKNPDNHAKARGDDSPLFSGDML